MCDRLAIHLQKIFFLRSIATGAGLIVSGVLLLALAWLWVRKIRLQTGGSA